jgi:subtilisin family serine protease
MLREGASLPLVLFRHHIRSDTLYRAINGFVAQLTPRQLALLRADRDVVIIEPQQVPEVGPPSPPLTPPPGIPHLYEFPQFTPWAVERVGALLSPTAHIDGVDERVDADVAVLDTGVDRLSDLNVAGGVDCISGRRGRSFSDNNGHGTEVAGTIGALDNAFGVVGVAPGARIWSVRVLSSDGNGTETSLLCGIDWLAEHADTIDVANLSLSGDFDPGKQDDGNCGLTTGDAFHLAICRVVARNVTIVAAAGNDSKDAALVAPAAYDEVITVSALSDSDGKPGGLGGPTCLEGANDDVFAFFSNFGADVDIAAPGVCVETTYPGDYEFINNGTSFAAPGVAGAAALWRASHPGAAPEAVKVAILQSREQYSMPGDPDGIDEGVLNVSTF